MEAGISAVDPTEHAFDPAVYPVDRGGRPDNAAIRALDQAVDPVDPTWRRSEHPSVDAAVDAADQPRRPQPGPPRTPDGDQPAVGPPHAFRRWDEAPVGSTAPSLVVRRTPEIGPVFRELELLGHLDVMRANASAFRTALGEPDTR